MAGNQKNVSGVVTASAKKTFWHQLFSWPVVGVATAILLSFGGCFVTSPHPYIADSFCIAGILLLIVKFWTWEESKHDTARKTGFLLAGGTLILLAIGVGLCALSNYMSKPANAQVDPPKQSLPLPPAPQIQAAPPPQSSPTANGPNSTVTDNTQINLPSNTQGNKTSEQQNDHGIINNGSVIGSNQTVQDNRQFGTTHSPPKTPYTQEAIAPILNAPAAMKRFNHGIERPGVKIAITLSDIFYNPIFSVKCSVPCQFSRWEVPETASSATASYGSQDKTTVLVTFGTPSQINGGTVVSLTLRSMDDQPISISDVEPYIPPLK